MRRPIVFDIHLPAMHAYVNARISNDALNVEVSDSVFTARHRETAE